MVDRQEVLRALQGVAELEPEAIKGVSVGDGRVRITLEAADESARQSIRESVRALVEPLEGVETVEVFYVSGTEQGAETPSREDAGTAATAPIELPAVGSILAVGAGKGGVGKSTLAVHLAVGLQRRGARVGVLDADVYGPSIATMLGIEGRKPEMVGEDLILPFDAGGIEVISMANFAPGEEAVLWRGPMVHSVLRQFLGNVAWGGGTPSPGLDYLLVDLPPGTGDVPLSLAQSVAVTGAVVVSTPQPVALNDAIRAARMYQQLGINVLGLVENMSYFVCSECGAEHDLFGRGGAKAAAGKLRLSFLGEIPLSRTLREKTDSARAGEDFDSDDPVGRAVGDVVEKLVEAVERRKRTGPPPKPLGVR